MPKCEQCGRQFHHCTSCGCDGYSEYELCSVGCRKHYELALSASISLSDALRIVEEMADDMDSQMPEESAALRKVLDAADRLDKLEAEVERLREECDFWRSHLHIDSPKMDGQHTWRLMWNHFTLVGSDAGEVVRNALEAIRSQPLPAPPVEEE